MPGEGGEQRVVIGIDRQKRAERPEHALLPVDEGAVAIEGEGAEGARVHGLILLSWVLVWRRRGAGRTSAHRAEMRLEEP